MSDLLGTLHVEAFLAVAVAEALLLLLLRLTNPRHWHSTVPTRMGQSCLIVGLGTVLAPRPDPLIWVPAAGLYSILWVRRAGLILASRWRWLSDRLQDDPRYAALWIERWRPATLSLSVAAVAALGPSIWSAALAAVVIARRREFFRFWPPRARTDYSVAVGGAVLLCVLGGVALGLALGRIAWVGPDEVNAFVTQLIAAELVLGVIPTTAAAIGIQVVGERVSLSALRMLDLDRSVSIPLGLMLASIGLNLVVLTRGDPILAEFAGLIGLVVVVNGLIHARRLLLDLDTGQLGEMATRRLSKRWWRAVRETFDQHGESRVLVGDPFGAVERLLALAVQESDASGFTELLHRLNDRIERIASRREQVTPDLEREGITSEEEVALDDYLARRLRGLIQSAAASGQDWVLDSLLELRRAIAPHQTKWQTTGGGRSGVPGWAPAHIHRAAFASPTGTRLVTAVARGAIQGRLPETAREALRALALYFRRATADLPPSAEVPLLVPLGAPGPKGPEAEENDDLQDGLDELIRTIEKLVEDAAARELASLTTDVAWDLAFAIDHLRYDQKELAWVRHLAFELFLAWKRVVELGSRHGVCALRIQSTYFRLDPANQIDMEVVTWMAACAQHGLLIDRAILDHHGISQCLDLTRHLLPSMPDIAGALTRRLDDVGETLRQRAAQGDQEATVIVETLTKGLERIRNEAAPFAADFNRGYHDAGS